MKKIRAILGNLDAVIAGVSLTIVICITLAGVVMRKVVGQPFAWLVVLFYLDDFLWGERCVSYRRSGKHRLDCK